MLTGYEILSLKFFSKCGDGVCVSMRGMCVCKHGCKHAFMHVCVCSAVAYLAIYLGYITSANSVSLESVNYMY